MNVKFSSHGTTLVVSLFGELDQHNAASLREQIDLKIAHTNVRHLIFDLSGLELMDSSGIGVIIGRYKLMLATGGRVSVAGGRASVCKILRLSGIAKIIRMYASLQDALKTA